MTSRQTPAASLRVVAQRREQAQASRRRAVASVGRAVRVVRPLAWVLGGGAIACFIAGVILSWTELLTAAAIVAAVMLISLLFLIGGTAYETTLGLARSRVVVGDRAFGSLTLGNAGTRTLPASRVILPVGPGRGAFDVPRMSAGQVREDLFSIPTHVRGVLPVGPISVLRGDPLGLFERVDSRHEAIELFIHPQTVALAGLSLGRIRDLEGLPTTDLASDDVSFHALREYTPGDDLRHVHWKSTARTGRVMVRQYEQTRRSTYLIGLGTNPGEYLDADEFELAVSIAASVGVRAVTDTHDVFVLASGRNLATMSVRRLLDDFSGLDTVRGTGTDLEGVSIALAAHPHALALAVMVCGSETSPASLRSAAARIPAGVRTLVVQAEVGAPSQLRRIGDAQAITIGSLDDLSIALRRVLA